MSRAEPLNVAFTTDENYVQHVAVTITSLLSNLSPGVAVCFTVIGDNLSAESVSRLKQIATKSDVSIVFPEVEFKYFDRVKHSYQLSHVSRATCGRLLVPDIIEEDKALYLDSDIIVREDISALWNIDISGHYCGAVSDPLINSEYKDHCIKLGMPLEALYFNAGVLLLNNKKCRQDNVMDNALKFMLANPDKLAFCDQDGLNAAMYHNWLPLHPRWNVQNCMFRMLHKGKFGNKFPSEIVETLKNPAIVHYTEDVKPWHYKCELPYVEEYYRYLAMTPWKDYQPKDWTFRGMIRKNRRMFKRRLKSALLGYRV